MVFRILPAAAVAGVLASAAVSAADVKVDVHKVTKQGVGEPIGTILFRDTPDQGMLVIPDLEGLKPGAHGFHIHENPDCSAKAKDGQTQAGGAAGGHLDPEKAGAHAGPVGKGHLGDLPQLLVGPDGRANLAVFAPRLQVPELMGRSVVIHENGDNFSDQPEKLGGGGERVACGVIGIDAL